MKYLLMLPLASLASCSLLQPGSPITPGGPTPIEVISEHAPGIIANAGTGQWVGAAYGAGSMILALLGKKGYDRVKGSGTGTFGFLAPKPSDA